MGPCKTRARGGALVLALLVGLATYAYADFGPAQGGAGGGGGGVANPMTADLNVASYLVQFGGTDSGKPAFRYGGSAGVIQLLRADASTDTIELRSVDDLKLSAGNALTLNAATGADVNFQINSTQVATLDASGLAMASGKGITNALHVVKVRRAAAQSMSDGAATDLSWDTEQLDTAGVSTVGAGASTTVLTTAASGEVWQVTANIALVSAASTPAFVIKLLDTDGTTTIQRGVSWSTTDAALYMQCSAVIVSTAASQTIRVHFNHDSAGNIDTGEGVSGDVSCTAVRVR